MLKSPLDTNIRIIQSSPGRTGSTLLTNILHGLYHDVAAFYSKIIEGDIFQSNFIVKTHDTNFDKIISEYKQFNLFFVCSERKEIKQTIDEKYRNYPNVIVFSYETELKETETFRVKDIVAGVANKLLNFLPYSVSSFIDIDNAINRIINMNKFYETIKDYPFSYYDDYYKIHGSHRNRNHI